MRILLDFRVLSGEWSGIAAYTFNLLKGLCKNTTTHDFFLLVKSDEIINRLQIKNELINNNIRIIFLNYDIYDFKNIFYLRKIINEEKIEIYFTTQYFWPFGFLPCKAVSMIHDIIPLLHPDLLYCSKKSKLSFLFKYTTWLSLKFSYKVVVNSDATLNTIQDFFGKGLTAKCRKLYPVFHNKEVNEDFSFSGFKYKGLENNYFLYVGRQDPYKNLVRLIEAFRFLKDEGYKEKLIITGKIDPRYREAKEAVLKYNLEEDVIFTDFVKFDELPALYSHAKFIILPSLIEGFGFTMLEAYIYGKISIASKIPAITEVLNDAGIFFNPLDAQDIKKSIIKAIALSSTEKEQLISMGKERLKFFSENRIMQDFLKIITE